MTIGHAHKIFDKGLGENFGGLRARLTDHSLSQLSYRPKFQAHSKDSFYIITDFPKM